MFSGEGSARIAIAVAIGGKSENTEAFLEPFLFKKKKPS
jgi:hypothetical protein